MWSKFSYSQHKYFTKSASITFDSRLDSFVPIKATNNSTSAVFESDNGDIAVLAQVKGFNFKNSLMQEHFNESYAESDIYPKSVFNGKIRDWNTIQLSENPTEVFIEGDLTIHGVKQKITQPGKIWRSSKSIIGESNFNVELVDYDVKVPKVVRSNIAEVINVNVSVQLNPR